MFCFDEILNYLKPDEYNENPVKITKSMKRLTSAYMFIPMYVN
jgi:hypothetical protein